MPKFFFTGRVRPEQHPLTMEYKPTYCRTEVQDGPSIYLTAHISDGEIEVVAEVDEFDETTWTKLYFLAYDMARTLVDVASFQDGIPYFATIDTVTDPNGKQSACIIADRRFARFSPARDAASLERLTDFAMSEVPFARVLSDVVVMLSTPHYAPIAAGRVAESLLRMLTEGRSSADWLTMQGILRIDRAYLQLLSDHSKPPRHGERAYVDGATNEELVTRAWTLMSRYVEYRLNESQGLDPNRFPVLKG